MLVNHIGVREIAMVFYSCQMLPKKRDDLEHQKSQKCPQIEAHCSLQEYCCYTFPMMVPSTTNLITIPIPYQSTTGNCTQVLFHAFSGQDNTHK